MSTSEYNYSESYYNTSGERSAESETPQDQESEPQPDLLQPVVGSVQASSYQSSSKESVSQKIENYGQQLQYELGLRGWTQEQLAEKIGVSKTDVQSWEDNQSVPDLASRQKLSRLFGNDFYLSKESHESRLPSGAGVPEAPLVTEPERFPLAGSNEERERAAEEGYEQSSHAIQGETVAEDRGERQPQQKHGETNTDNTDEQPMQERQGSRKALMNYGQWLRSEREKRGWTPNQLAEMLGLPIAVIRRWEKNQAYPDTTFRQKLTELLGKGISSTSLAAGTLQIRITQKQVTAQNFTTIISALTELHTECWLIQQGRFVEAIEYAQTHNVKFAEEANLVITRLAYNSPLWITFAPLDPKNIADALVTAIDSVTQMGQRHKKIELENQEKAEQIREAERKADQEYQAKLQELAIAAQKAAQDSQMAQLEQEKQKFELERQRSTFQIEQERQKLELERQQMALQREQLELVNMRMNYAIETANKMVSMLQPDSEQATRAMLAQTLLPSLLQLGSGKGLNLALPAPQHS